MIYPRKLMISLCVLRFSQHDNKEQIVSLCHLVAIVRGFVRNRNPTVVGAFFYLSGLEKLMCFFIFAVSKAPRNFSHGVL
jgi:hypothetical protein